MEQKKKKRKWLIFCALWVILGLIDAGLTYWNTPDLKQEANPLVSRLGLGWGALFTANLCVFVLYCVWVWFAFVKYESNVSSKGLTMLEYIEVLCYGKKVNPRWIIFRTPKEAKTSKCSHWPTIAWMGYAYAHISLIHRSILIYEWLTVTLHIHTPVYDSIDRALSGNFNLIVCAAALVLLGLHWARREYRNAKDK